MRAMLAVPGKQFVASNAGEQNCGLLARLATDDIRRNNSRVGDGFVHVPGSAGQKAGDIGLNCDLLIFDTEAAGQTGGNIRIVEPVFTDAMFRRIRDRVRPERLPGRQCQHRYNAR